EFEGVTPIEMFGLVQFPSIEPDKPYVLTLSSYGFYWLLLQSPKPMPIGALQPATEEKVGEAPAVMPTYDADLSVGWKTLLNSDFRELFEGRILSPYIQRQRWFGKKSRRIVNSRIADWSELTTGDSPGAIILVEVTYDSGG